MEEKKAPRLDSSSAPTQQDTPPASDHPAAPTSWLKRTPFFRTRRRAVLTVSILVLLTLCLGYWVVGRLLFADAASLVQIKGVVQTRQEAEPQWQLAQINELIGRKRRVRTGDNSGARLLFFDVSTVDLDENTEISISQCARGRQGSSVDVVIKMWVGSTVVRAVRFVDPSSTLRIETPTASTVVRGARFSVQVADDGTTQIELQEGQAEVKLAGTTIPLKMGERITLDPGGHYTTEPFFVPDSQPVIDRVNEAWSAPGEVMTLTLTESEVNQFLAAMGQQSDFGLRDTQVWFIEDEIRIATTVVKPVTFDLSAALSPHVVAGQIEPEVHEIAAGVRLPLPAPLLNLAVEAVLDQMEGYLQQAYDLVEFTDVQIADGVLIVSGYKNLASSDSN